MCTKNHFKVKSTSRRSIAGKKDQRIDCMCWEFFWFAKHFPCLSQQLWFLFYCFSYWIFEFLIKEFWFVVAGWDSVILLDFVSLRPCQWYISCFVLYFYTMLDELKLKVHLLLDICCFTIALIFYCICWVLQLKYNDSASSNSLIFLTHLWGWFVLPVVWSEFKTTMQLIIRGNYH